MSNGGQNVWSVTQQAGQCGPQSSRQTAGGQSRIFKIGRYAGRRSSFPARARAARLRPVDQANGKSHCTMATKALRTQVLKGRLKRADAPHAACAFSS